MFFTYMRKFTIPYIVFVIIFLGLGVYSWINGSQWILDNIFSIISMSILFYFADKLYMDYTGFIFSGLGFFSHSIGTFGLYNITQGLLGYDVFVHLISSFAAGWVVYTYISKKFSARKYSKTLLVFLAVSVVCLLGVFIEFIEFIGFFFFEEGEGLFFTGAGDLKLFEGEVGVYVDTMIDIFVNTVGSIIGIVSQILLKRR